MYRCPGLLNEDAALMKSFVIKEKKHVQVRLEAYGVTNSPHEEIRLGQQLRFSRLQT